MHSSQFLPHVYWKCTLFLLWFIFSAMFRFISACGSCVIMILKDIYAHTRMHAHIWWWRSSSSCSRCPCRCMTGWKWGTSLGVPGAVPRSSHWLSDTTLQLLPAHLWTLAAETPVQPQNSGSWPRCCRHRPSWGRPGYKLFLCTELFSTVLLSSFFFLSSCSSRLILLFYLPLNLLSFSLQRSSSILSKITSLRMVTSLMITCGGRPGNLWSPGPLPTFTSSFIPFIKSDNPCMSSRAAMQSKLEMTATNAQWLTVVHQVQYCGGGERLLSWSLDEHVHMSAIYIVYARYKYSVLCRSPFKHLQQFSITMVTWYTIWKCYNSWFYNLF